MEDKKKAFQERLDRVNKAIALETTDRVPLCPFFASYVQRSQGSSYRDIYYDPKKAGEAAVKFYEAHPMLDASYGARFTSGPANELAGTNMIDWPGRPGTMVDNFSSHQVIEREYMSQEEYKELLTDYTGFMLRKYIPRAFPNLKGLENMTVTAGTILSINSLGNLFHPEVLEAYKKLEEIAAAEAENTRISNEYSGKLTEMGFPIMFTGGCEAPYDILGDYYRGTMGMFEDLVDEDMEDYVEQACYMFADQQIQKLQYFKVLDLPVKRVFFPLHKGMDGFMNERQYEKLYWKPLKKIVMALIDMGVTPYLYGEGPYSSRLEMLTDVPKGKVLYHFEKVDMKEAKRILGGTACIMGNLPISDLEFGSKETVVTKTRQLLEDCMPDGGYIFDFDGCLENAKPENLDAMFEVLDQYGRY